MTRRSAFVHRFPARAPDDVAPIEEAIRSGLLRPEGIVAVLGKTEGNGNVNDFTRAFAVRAVKDALRPHLAPEAVERISYVMSGGTEGALAPHWIVLGRTEAPAGESVSPALAVGGADAPPLAFEDLGRIGQVRLVAEGARAAMRDAGIDDPADVHFVQIKCPLLTAERIAAVAARGKSVAVRETLKSMGLSRGASALGVALALGAITEAEIGDEAIGRDTALYSGRASTSAGVELENHEIVVLGMSDRWAGPLAIDHAVMNDSIDVEPVRAALKRLGFQFSMDNITDFRIDGRELADRGVRYLKVPAPLLLGQQDAASSDIHAADLSSLLTRFGVDLIAEKIEGERSVLDLLDYNVRFGQGFLFSAPRPLRPEAAVPTPVAASSQPKAAAPPLAENVAMATRMAAETRLSGTAALARRIAQS